MKRKLISLVLIVAMLFSISITASAEEGIMPISLDEEAGIMPISVDEDEGVMPISEDEENILLIAPNPNAAAAATILYTNDIHTALDKDLTYSLLASYKASLGEDTLLVDAGDHIQGTAFGSLDYGATIVELMNAVGYDAATLGNHEFDYGMERTLEVSHDETPYVSANFLAIDGEETKPVLDPYIVVEAGELKIAFVGITTPESIAKSTPAYFQNEEGEYIYDILGLDSAEDLYESVQTAIDAASEEADYVIALGHLGVDLSSGDWTSTKLIENTTGLDAFIDGHSHTVMESEIVEDAEGNEVVLTQTGDSFANIGKLCIYADGTIATELVTAEDLVGLEPDETVKAIEDEWITEVDALLGTVIGSIDYPLDNYDAEGKRLVRTQETNTGDFVTDALYYYFNDKLDLDTDVAIMNGGGIRNKAIEGELSYLSCKSIHTFGNYATLQQVTGQQILDALEWGAKDVALDGSVENGGFLQVSGLKYTIDPSIESTVQADEKGIWIGGPTGEYRVTEVEVYNKETGEYEPLDLEASYNLAGYSYTLRNLGDGFAMFDGAVNILDYAMTDYLVLAEYVQSFEDGKVTGYEEPQGRITVLFDETAVEDKPTTIGGLDNNLWTTKYGNIYCDMSAEKFVEAGYTWGDIVKVSFLNTTLELPVVPTYSYVDSGEPAIIMGATDTGAPTGYLSFAINMGNFTETYGIATKQTDEEGNWWWTAVEGVSFPLEISFEMAEEDGYADQIILRELVRTNAREDYAHLSDEQFANFREVTTTGVAPKTLYRSSSPVNNELGRNEYALAAAIEAGIKTVINLADAETDGREYTGLEADVIYLSLGVDFAAADFQSGLATGLKFMAEHKGPYLVHCTEGKDRAGFVSALLECLAGATADEVVSDYMVTYYNYYGVEPGSEKYTAIAESNIIKSLCQAFGIETFEGADLKAEATEYLTTIGLTETEIAALVTNLTTAPTTEPETTEPSTGETETTEPSTGTETTEPSTGTETTEPSTGTETTEPEETDGGETTYTVVAGDTLWGIAKRLLGSGLKWDVIYKANTGLIKNPDLIYAGWQLVIPQ